MKNAKMLLAKNLQERIYKMNTLTSHYDEMIDGFYKEIINYITDVNADESPRTIIVNATIPNASKGEFRLAADHINLLTNYLTILGYKVQQANHQLVISIDKDFFHDAGLFGYL